MPESASGVALSVLQQIESHLLRYLSHVPPVWLLAGGYAISASLFGFSIVGIDKFQAAHGGWRISEVFILKVAYAGGCWGIAVGMFLFHNKTEKEYFVGLVVGALVVWFFAFEGLAHVFGGPPPL
jgi:uncharacterized membrane protein YsdA (DUF1294 family)